MPKNTHLFIALKIIKTFGMAFANIFVKLLILQKSRESANDTKDQLYVPNLEVQIFTHE